LVVASWLLLVSLTQLFDRSLKILERTEN
jgi:hypothetical protein